MWAILKLIWFFLSMKLVSYIMETTNQTINPDHVTNNILTHLSFLNPFEEQIRKGVAQFINQMEFVLFFTILLLGVDLLNGQFKGLTGPIKIVLNAVLYLLGFSLIIFIFGFNI